MAYVTLPTIVTGTLVTADDWNQVGDNFDHLASMKAGGAPLSTLAAGSELGLPAGVIVPYAGSVAPSGWLLCYGQAVSRTTYAALFSAISNTYGDGDGGSTFNLPDLRGRLPLGKDNMGGTSANRVGALAADQLGGNGGLETHLLTTDEMPAHSHGLSAAGTDTAGTQTTRIPGALPGATLNTTITAFSMANTGGGLAHNNMPPYLTLNYLIKT